MAAATTPSSISWRTAGMSCNRPMSLRPPADLGRAMTLMRAALRSQGGWVGLSLVWGRRCLGNQIESATDALQTACSDRHVHHVLVRLHEAVADFHRGAECDLRLLHRDHHPRQVRTRITEFEGGLQVVCGLLGAADVVDSVRQGLRESGLGAGGG